MNVCKIKTLEDIMNAFTEYEYSVSDDMDTVHIEFSNGLEDTYEGDSIFEMLEGLGEVPGAWFSITASHDCPGCCLAPASKTVVFERVTEVKDDYPEIAEIN